MHKLLQNNDPARTDEQHSFRRANHEDIRNACAEAECGKPRRVLLLHQNQNTHTHRTEHRELDDESAGEDRHP